MRCCVCLKGCQLLLVKKQLFSAVSVLPLLAASQQPNPEAGRRRVFLVNKLGWPRQTGKFLFHLIMPHWKGTAPVLPAKCVRREHALPVQTPRSQPEQAPHCWRSCGGTGELFLATAFKEFLRELGYKNHVHLRKGWYLGFCFFACWRGFCFCFFFFSRLWEKYWFVEKWNFSHL